MTEKTEKLKIERAPKGVIWTDLVDLSRSEILRELCLPLPWLVLSMVLYATALWPLGGVASFMFFLCALRLNHEAIHGNLGISRRGDSVVMHVLSAMMLGSNHAFCHGHLVHHRNAMGPDDHEGRCGHMSLSQVLLYGPRFPIDVTRVAWQGSNTKNRRKILLDWALVAGAVFVALIAGQAFILLHVGAMLLAQCLSAFFAVWITHQGTGSSGVAARSQRGILARLAYLMFYHREHHLFPKVPVRRLPDLADRLDRTVPGYAANRLPVISLLDPGQ